MKHVTRIMMVLIFVSLVLGSFAVLNAAADDVKKEDTEKSQVEKYCCPMCKKDIAKDEAKIKVEYKEKTFYFCCEKCKAEFEKDPEKYSKCCKENEPEVYYVCPMKQCDVKADKPGKCPKCGMELKKVTAQAACCKHEKEPEHEHQHE